MHPHLHSASAPNGTLNRRSSLAPASRDLQALLESGRSVYLSSKSASAAATVSVPEVAKPTLDGEPDLIGEVVKDDDCEHALKSRSDSRSDVSSTNGWCVVNAEDCQDRKDDGELEESETDLLSEMEKEEVSNAMNKSKTDMEGPDSEQCVVAGVQTRDTSGNWTLPHSLSHLHRSLTWRTPLQSLSECSHAEEPGAVEFSSTRPQEHVCTMVEEESHESVRIFSACGPTIQTATSSSRRR